MEEINAGAVQAGTESGSGEAQGTGRPEPATVFGFAPPEDAAPTETAGHAAGNTGEPEQDPAQEDAAPPKQGTRKRNAFLVQRRNLENKYRNDPAMKIGQQLVRDVMTQEGCTREQAVEKIQARFIDAYAKRENVGPNAARVLYQASMDAAEETEDGYGRNDAQETPEERAASIVEDLLSVRVPSGFDMDAAVEDPAFQELLVEYPAKAAVRIYMAEQRTNEAPREMADRLRARQGVPASTKPQQAIRPEPNYREMSRADFFAMKEKLAKQLQ